MQSNVTTGAASGSAMSGIGGSMSSSPQKPVQGGRFDFDDGGMYCGGWEDGKAHGHGVCTGLKGQGEYSGSWNYGFEVSGVYTWPGGSTYEGHWQNGKRHGLGVESRGRWIYRGEWTQGFKGRYGVRQSLTSTAKYDGTWANGLQDGYGSETYADGGTYQGQWLRGLRHGYGVRTSAAFGMASRFRPKSVRSSMTSLRSGDVSAGHHHGHHHSGAASSSGGAAGGGAGADPAADRDKRLDDGRGGFVLKARSDEPPTRRRSFSERSSTIKKTLFQGLRLKKQHSTGELEKRGTSASIRSTGSSASWMSTESSQSGMTGGSHHTDSNASFIAEDEPLDASVTETYMGEWKNDKRAGFGISERSDGLKYEGEWFNNKKYGYGVTTLKDGTKEEGKYKNNVLITSQKKKHLFLIRSAKFRERIEAAVSAAQRASKIALQKADIAISRTSTARGKAELADVAAVHAREDADFAVIIAKQLAPDFQPSAETMRPPLAVLARLIPHQLSTSAATGPAGPSSTQAKTGPNYLMPNNIQHSDGYGYMGDGAVPAGSTNAVQQPVATSRTEDYGGGGGGLMPSMGLTGGGSGGGTSELSRRPSVAIGGVRSPSNFQNKMELDHSLVAMNSYSSPNNSRSPAGVIPSGFGGPSNYSNNINNNNINSSHSLLARKNSQDQFGLRASLPVPSQQQLQQQQLQQQQQQYSSSSYNQASNYDGGGPYSSSGDEMRGEMGLAGHGQLERGRSSLRRGPALSGSSFGGGVGGGYVQESNNPSYNFQQAMNDHFDHYKRPPSRDRSRDPSMDRFSRSSRQSSIALTRQESSLMGSRGPSPAPTPSQMVFRSNSRQRPPLLSSSPTPSSLSSRFHQDSADGAGHANQPSSGSLQRRMATPIRETSTSPGNGSVPGFGGGNGLPGNIIEDMLLRQRLGQEIPHDGGGTIKRTESLYISPARKKEMVAPAPVPKRKKSLPGAADAPAAILSREEASVLSSQRREEVRRQVEEAERYRANPLLYFCSPQVKGWLARQQLTIFILIINLSLAYLFFKLLT